MVNPSLGAVPANVHSIVRMVGLTAGTEVLTLDGALPVQFLGPGDRIITRAGARILREISVTAICTAPMIRIAASALGSGCPAADQFLPPSQILLLRGGLAKALCNKDQALVEAQRLADGETIRMEMVADLRLFALKFDHDEIIFAGGLELSCPA